MASIRKFTRKGGREMWEVRITRTEKDGAKKQTSRSFESFDEARRWANFQEATIDKTGRISTSPDKVFFSDACADFLQDYRPPRNKAGKLTENERQLVVAANARLHQGREKPITVSQITHKMLGDFIEDMLNTKVSSPDRKKIHPLYRGATPRAYSESTVRKLYFQIRKVLRWHSQQQKYSLDSNLFTGHAVPRPWAGRRKRRLEEGELESLFAAADQGYEHKEEWKLLIEFALATAARSQEILKAKWEDVNLPGRAWNIPPENVKTSTFRQVPLSKAAISILKKMQKFQNSEDPRIFRMWRDSATISKGFRRLTARAKVLNFRFHDLRHEAVSRIFENTDLSDSEIMSITGHTNVQTLVGYAHLRASFLASKLDGAGVRPIKVRKTIPVAPPPPSRKVPSKVAPDSGGAPARPRA